MKKASQSLSSLRRSQTFFSRCFSTKEQEISALLRRNELRFQDNESVELMRVVRHADRELRLHQSSVLRGEPVVKNVCGSFLVVGEEGNESGHVKQSLMSYDGCNQFFIGISVPFEQIHFVFFKDAYTVGGKILDKSMKPLFPNEAAEKLKSLGKRIIQSGGDEYSNTGWMWGMSQQINEIVFNYTGRQIFELGVTSYRPGHVIEDMEQELQTTSVAKLDRPEVFSLVSVITPLLSLKYGLIELQYLYGDAANDISIVKFDGRNKKPMEMTADHFEFIQDRTHQILGNPEFQTIASGKTVDEYHTPQALALLRAHKTLEDAGQLTFGKAWRKLI